MKRVAAVRYGLMEAVEHFDVPEGDFRRGDEVIVRTGRGVEWGRIVSSADARNDEGATQVKPGGEILRKVTGQDRAQEKEITQTRMREELGYCQELIRKQKLPMKLVNVEHLFGGNKIIFCFLADGRVDFRELVKQLAQKYRTRIEMRQIGVRDEARLLGFYGPCGRELCCRTFLKALKPIPMKMAKNQKSTLDPAKVSGRCGRLKCCLRFEDSLYLELKQNLPRRGTKVNTEKGQGLVINYDIIAQTVSVDLGDGKQTPFDLADVEIVEEEKEELQS